MRVLTRQIRLALESLFFLELLDLRNEQRLIAFLEDPVVLLP